MGWWAVNGWVTQGVGRYPKFVNFIGYNIKLRLHSVWRKTRRFVALKRLIRRKGVLAHDRRPGVHCVAETFSKMTVLRQRTRAAIFFFCTLCTRTCMHAAAACCHGDNVVTPRSEVVLP